MCWRRECWWKKSGLPVDPIISRVLYIPGGAGFLPSTVGWLRGWHWMFHTCFTDWWPWICGNTSRCFQVEVMYLAKKREWTKWRCIRCLKMLGDFQPWSWKCDGIQRVLVDTFQSSSWIHPAVTDHQDYSRGLYTQYKDSLFSRWDDHPQYKELIDPGTYKPPILHFFRIGNPNLNLHWPLAALEGC